MVNLDLMGYMTKNLMGYFMVGASNIWDMSYGIFFIYNKWR
jgi:hypothetical protein